MAPALIRLVESTAHFHGVGVPSPVAPGHPAHDIPGNGRADGVVHPLAAVQHQAETAVDGVADPCAAAVVQGCHGHAPGAVSGKAVGGHISHDIAAVLDVGGFPKRGICPSGVVVIAPDHNGADLTLSHHFVEPEGDVDSAGRILVKNARLGSHHEVVLLGIPDPGPVVPVLESVFGINAGHGGPVGFYEIFVPAAEADPAKRAIAEVKDVRAHDVLEVGGKDEAILGVHAVLGYFRGPCIEYGFQKGIAVIKEK